MVPAREFLTRAVRDGATARTDAALEALPTPEYVRTLEQLLVAHDIKYVHIGRRIDSKKRQDGYESWRVYRVKSFVWHDSLFIIRDWFSGEEFQKWPPQLREVWLRIVVDVPDANVGH